MYVVDAADFDNLATAARELHALLEKTSLASVPLLVLGNKNDLPGALGTQELIERMNLQVGVRCCRGWQWRCRGVAGAAACCGAACPCCAARCKGHVHVQYILAGRQAGRQAGLLY